jgi:hypothetical protein
MIQRTLLLLLALLLTAAAAGCGSEKDKGINKDMDRPREPATGPAK